MLNTVKRFFGKVYSNLSPSRETMRSIAPAVFVVVFLFFLILPLTGFLAVDSLGTVILYLFFYLLVGLVVSILSAILIKLAARIPPKYLTTIIFAGLCVFPISRLPKIYGWTFFFCVVILPSFIVAGIYKWRNGTLYPLKGFKKIFSFVLFIFSSVLFVVFLFMFFGTGSINKPVKNVGLLAKRPPDTLTAPDPSKPGPYTVASLTYGSGRDKRRDEFGKNVTIKTSTVDASLMLKSWSGVSGKLRTSFFGFDQSALPLNARVWYPKNQDTLAPLVLIVHGNHLAQDYSDGGYAYLAERLASKGYIVASVDENFINSSITDLDMFGGGLKEENGVRGWLLLKHLENWRKWNQDPASAFYHKVDIDRIAIIGHSRGGEAVGHAALFNKLPCFPDDANEKFNFNFNIRAVIAIAPVDGQYKPAAILAPLKDVNYFVFHGSHDMDMASYGGLATYKRVQYSPEFTGFKAGLYIGSANHGQFNTGWGRKDASSPYINRYNLRQLISAEDQQQIARTFINAFLEITLKDKSVYKPLFMDYRFGRQWLPKTIYLNQFEPSKKLVLADYDEDLNLQTTTLKGGEIQTTDIKIWKEQSFKTEWGGLLTRAAYIGWKEEKDNKAPAVYSITLPDSLTSNISDKLLVFSLTEGSDKPSDNKKVKPSKPGMSGGKSELTDSSSQKKSSPEISDRKQNNGKKSESVADKTQSKKDENPIDFTIELKDKKGESIKFLLSECGFLQPPVKKNITKFSFLNEAPESEAIPGFFYFDFNKLKALNASFNPDDLKQIRFVFDQRKEGTIILDDLWLMENEL